MKQVEEFRLKASESPNRVGVAYRYANSVWALRKQKTIELFTGLIEGVKLFLAQFDGCAHYILFEMLH